MQFVYSTSIQFSGHVPLGSSVTENLHPWLQLHLYLYLFFSHTYSWVQGYSFTSGGVLSDTRLICWNLIILHSSLGFTSYIFRLIFNCFVLERNLVDIQWMVLGTLSREYRIPEINIVVAFCSLAWVMSTNPDEISGIFFYSN